MPDGGTWTLPDILSVRDTWDGTGSGLVFPTGQDLVLHGDTTYVGVWNAVLSPADLGNIGSTWSPVGETIEATDATTLGTHVALSADGTRLVALASPSGAIHTSDWVGSAWTSNTVPLADRSYACSSGAHLL